MTNKDAYNKGWDDGAKATYEHLKMCEEEQGGDLISRQAVLDVLEKEGHKWGNDYRDWVDAIEEIKKLPPVNPQEPKWIPVSERLPEDLEPVNITWVNHEPEPYYHDIKDKNFVATGIYYRGQWYWYSTTCADYLGEYGSNEIDEVDSAIEIVAWIPLPEPYKAESDHKCHTCKHYTSGEYDGSCDSYICNGYSDWESEDEG